MTTKEREGARIGEGRDEGRRDERNVWTEGRRYTIDSKRWKEGGVMDNNTWQNEMTCHARKKEGEQKKGEKGA